MYLKSHVDGMHKILNDNLKLSPNWLIFKTMSDSWKIRPKMLIYRLSLFSYCIVLWGLMCIKTPKLEWWMWTSSEYFLSNNHWAEPLVQDKLVVLIQWFWISFKTSDTRLEDSFVFCLLQMSTWCQIWVKSSKPDSWLMVWLLERCPQFLDVLFWSMKLA